MANISIVDFVKEARRRRVFRTAAIYIVAAWVVLQVAALAFPGLDIEDSAIRYVWLGAILGLPIALFVGWRYDVVGSRIVRTSPAYSQTDPSIQTTDYLILGILTLVVVATAFGLVGEISKVRVTQVMSSSLVDIAPNSVAVMPFHNMSNDPQNVFLSEGISEDILNQLVKIPELRVTSRSSAFSFKDQNLDMQTIAERLKVAYILDGSVRKLGNQLRITVQLIATETDSHIWSESYDREFNNVFAMQGEIAEAVAGAMKIKLLSLTPVVPEAKPEAYTLYLQARHLARQGSNSAAFEEAVSLLLESVEIDPDYLESWHMLVEVYVMQRSYGFLTVAEAAPLIREAMLKELEIDPEKTRNRIARYDRDLAVRAQHLERELKLLPSDINVIEATRVLLAQLGRVGDAIPVAQHQVALDPANHLAHGSLGRLYTFAGRWDEAIAAHRTAIALSPGALRHHSDLAMSLLFNGEPQAALEANQSERPSIRSIGLPIIYFALGMAEKSDAALNVLIEQQEQEAAYNIAYVLAYRGENDRAFKWLDKAVHYRDPGLDLINFERLFENIWTDPRWLPFLLRIGRSPEQLDAIEFTVTLPD